jgi:hypothetical protein
MAQDEANKRVPITLFNGGLADAEKLGIPGAFGGGRNLDIHQDPNQLTLAPKTTKESGSVITGLVKWMVAAIDTDTSQPYYGFVYAYDENGVIYERNAAGTWSVKATIADSKGQGLCYHSGYLYYTSNHQLGRINLATGANDPAWQVDLENTQYTGWAPILPFGPGFVVGHGHKMGKFDGSVWEAATLTLTPGASVRTLELVNEYVWIGCVRGVNITDSEEGLAFSWDGVQPNYNFATPVMEGGVNAMLNSRNRLMSVVGSTGILYQGTEPFNKLQQFPGLSRSKYIEIFPGAVTNWRGFALIAVSGNTDDAAAPSAIYQWGSRSARYEEVLSPFGTISTGSTAGTTVKISALLGKGNKLFVAWRDGSSYGIDVVDGVAPYASGYYETLVIDMSKVYSEKRASAVKVTHFPLADGESVTLGFKKARAASYTTGNPTTTVGAEATKLSIGTGNILHTESRIRITLATSNGATAPTVTGLMLEFEDGTEETIVTGVEA